MSTPFAAQNVMSQSQAKPASVAIGASKNGSAHEPQKDDSSSGKHMAFTTQPITSHSCCQELYRTFSPSEVGLCFHDAYKAMTANSGEQGQASGGFWSRLFGK